MIHKTIQASLTLMTLMMISWVSIPTATIREGKIQTLEATTTLHNECEVDESPIKEIVDPSTIEYMSYPQKAEIIRQIIVEEFKGEDPFVLETVRLYGPKIILACQERGFKTPGERVAQLLLESSKMKDGKRVWSNLTLKHNNFGGVKATKDTKATEPLATQEVVKGRRGTYKLKFAKFDTKWDGMSRYLKVVSSKRYAKAMQKHGYEHFYALARAGYCTEPADSYAEMCTSMYSRYKLSKLNKILREWEKLSVMPSHLLAQQ